MDRLLSMEVFVAAVDGGSLTAAAERFGISAPMAGRHLRALEERLGARLLARSTRRQSLTEVGRAYYDRCKAILEEIRAAESGAEALQSTPRGRLRVTAPVSFGSMCLAPALVDLLAAHPELGVELHLGDSLVDLVEEGFDAAIRIGRLADSALVARPLAPYRMVICASPAYLARMGTPRTPADVAAHQCLDFSLWRGRGGWRLVGREQADAPPLPASRFESNHGGALRMAALAGFGLVMQPEVLLADDIAAGRLVALLPDALPPPLPVHLVYPRDRQPVAKLRAFIDFVLARFGTSLATPRPAAS